MLGLLAGLRRGHARNNRIVSSLNSLFPSSPPLLSFSSAPHVKPSNQALQQELG